MPEFCRTKTGDSSVPIQVCPNCGHQLKVLLYDGLAHCDHCCQMFDSSDYNRFLSAAWQVRKEHLSLEQIKWQLKFSEDFAIFVYTYIVEYEYSHEEFLHFLRKLGISRECK